MGQLVSYSFADLSTAMKIIRNCETSILNNLSAFKKQNTVNSNWFYDINGKDLTIGTDLPIVINIDSLSISVHFKKTKYYIGLDTIGTYAGARIDIEGIEEASDMFNLSTVRDFYDLTFDDILNHNYIYKMLISNVKK